MEDLIRLSPLNEDNSDRWEGFLLQHNLQSEHFALAEVEKPALSRLKPEKLRLALEDVSLSDSDVSARTPVTATENDESLNNSPSDLLAEDTEIWALIDVQQPPMKKGLVSWDKERGQSDQENVPLYASEASPRVYDAMLRQGLLAAESKTIKYVRPDIFEDVLCSLAVGRSSVMFSWNSVTFGYDQKVLDYTLSGLSKPLTQHLTQWFIESGICFRKLRTLTCGSSTTATALTSAVSNGLNAAEEYLATARANAGTPLRLRRWWNPVRQLLSAFEMVALPSMKGKDDAEHLQKFMECLKQTSQKYPNFHGVFREMSKRVLDPFLLAVGARLGLSRLHCENDLVPNLPPGLLPTHCISMMDEISVNMAVLQDNGVEHALFTADTATSDHNKLHIVYHCDALIELQQSADAHERNAIQLVHSKFMTRSRLDGPVGSSLPATNRKLNTKVDPFKLDFAVYDKHSLTITDPAHNETNPLKREIRLAFNTFSLPDTFSVTPYEALEMSIMPWILAQHRLTSYTILRTLFLEHNLPLHLDLLHRIELLDDGAFASRLSRALFDPDQASGEGTRRTGAVTGLRLDSRDTWPPTSSELRLVLMGILTESITSSNLVQLQDSISFAIRELPDDELERCRDVDSIFALDFLRLFYKPSTTAIEMILSPDCLEKYDRIFKHLLLLLRMKAVTQDLLLSSIGRHHTTLPLSYDHKLRLDLFRFSSAIIDYSQNVAINVPWRRLQNIVQTMNRHLVRQDYQATMDVIHSVSQFRLLHESMLDDILSALLLKRKQAEAKKILDEIFTLGLQFASSNMRNSHDAKPKLRQFYQVFRAKACEFLLQLRKITGRQNEPEESLVQHLLVKLDMGNYYEGFSNSENE